MNKSKISLLGIVLALIAGFALGASIGTKNLPPTTNELPRTATATQTVSIVLDFGDGKLTTLHNLTFENNETLFHLLEQTAAKEKIAFATQEYKGLGTLITQIGEKKNGEDNKYWQYWVNNRHAAVGADQYVLKPGDVIEWKFTSFAGE